MLFDTSNLHVNDTKFPTFIGRSAALLLLAIGGRGVPIIELLLVGYCLEEFDATWLTNGKTGWVGVEVDDWWRNWEGVEELEEQVGVFFLSPLELNDTVEGVLANLSVSLTVLELRFCFLFLSSAPRLVAYLKLSMVTFLTESDDGDPERSWPFFKLPSDLLLFLCFLDSSLSDSSPEVRPSLEMQPLLRDDGDLLSWGLLE